MMVLLLVLFSASFIACVSGLIDMPHHNNLPAPSGTLGDILQALEDRITMSGRA